MSSIHRLAVRLLIGALLAAALGGCSWWSGAGPSGHGRTPAHVRCTRARIGPRIECLRAGVRCDPRYNNAYGQYGFVCRQTTSGSHHLRQRIFQGTPLPAPNSNG
jgi:hypothetical protein